MIRLGTYINIIFALFIAVSAGLSADRITDIQYPLMGRPTIVKAGDSFIITSKGSSSSSNWSVRIYTPYNSVNLNTNATWNETKRRWSITASVPANTPFELYDLQVTASDVNDVTVHAVKVISEYKDSYYFVHLPDLHLPSVSWIGYYDDSNTIPEFLKIMNEISIINPEFVLQTGDLVDNGQVEDQYELAQELVSASQAPVFFTGGNHDLWYDGHRYWKRYISPTMDYSFNYGSHHYAGLEMYDIPTVTFTADQMEWLQDDLQGSIDDGDALRTLFYHYDESRQIDDDFVDNFMVDMILYGHTHINGENTLGSRAALNLNTSFTMNNNGQYRLVKVSGDEVQSWPLLKFKNLNVDYSPANDGTNWQVKASIQNDNNVAFEDAMIKFYVAHDNAGYQVTGGDVAQVITSSQTDVYYVNVSIPANSEQQVEIVSNSPPANRPPAITSVTPGSTDTLIIAGIDAAFSARASDPDNNSLSYRWYVDGNQVNGSAANYNYKADKNYVGHVELTVRVSDGSYYDDYTWLVEVDEYTDRPRVTSSTLNFFLQNEEMVLEWVEPQPINARFEFGLQPGFYTGSVEENGNNSVVFTPELAGMGLGVHYCRITDGDVSSDPFTVIIESPIAPQMLTPIGNIEDLAPMFTWDRVPGVPYYIVICSDEEIIIEEDPESREFTVEGANPIWSVLTSDNSVPYGMADPSGTYTSVPAPLIPGNSYWWVVLNCYGNAAELTSPVQSGISKFTIDLPPPDIDKPILKSPANNVLLDQDIITFTWDAVSGAKAYHFYPFKIEEEFGIETARAVWQSTITTTETQYDYPAGEQFMKGRYRWKVAAVAENGLEVLSDGRDFEYDAPSAKLSIHTYDSKNTATTSDDIVLPRVTIVYDAINGIHNDMPLSTDLYGSRLDYNISPGVYQFKITKEGYDTRYDTLTFVADQSYSVNYRLSPSLSAVLGRVVDGNGSAINDVSVTAQHGLHSDIKKTTSTDAQGYFRITVAPGPYLIYAKKTGYQLSDTLSVSVTTGQQKELSQNLVMVKNTNKVAGKVVNTNQQPIYGARVILKNGETFETTTDANGQFSFSVPDATWTLHVEKQGFVSPEPRTLSTSGGQTITVTPSLVLESNAGILQGRATDGSRQLENVIIKAYPVSGQPYQTTTDAYGQFTLNVVQGTYSISVEKEGYISPEAIQSTVTSGQTKSGIEFVLNQATSTVKGKVTIDGYTPLADALVSNSGKSTSTSDGGYFELGILPGTHIIKAAKEGYLSSSPDTITVVAGQVLDNVNFILSPNASVIKGKITSGNGPVYNALVQAVNSHTIETKSDQHGNFVLNLQAGTWDLVVSKSGFITQEKTSQLVGTSQTLNNVDFDLQPNIATIQGSVINSFSGAAISNAEISIPSAGLNTRSATDGSFTLSIEPGSYTVYTGKTGYRTVEKTTGSIALNAVKTMEFQLEQLSSSFTGSIVDAQSNSVENAIVYAANAVDTFTTVSKTDGTYRLDVKPAMYNVFAEKNGYKPATVQNQASVADNESKSLNSATLLSDMGNITGTVSRVTIDAPVVAARVTAKSQDGFLMQTESDNNGYFSFQDENGQPALISGTYNVRISKSGFTPDTLFDIHVAGEQTVAVDAYILKNEGVISGQIKSDKASLADVTVSAQKVGTETFFTTLSQDDGSFIIKNIPLGTYTITTAKAGYSSPDAITVETGTTQEIILTENKGRLSGKVIDSETHLAIAGVQISATDGHGNYASGVTDPSGSYDFQKLAQTFEYTIKYAYNGYSQKSQAAVKLSEATVLDVEIEKIYGNITGTITDASGAKLQSVTITAQTSDSSYTTLSDDNGVYSFIHLPAAQYTLSAFKVGYASDPVQQIVSLWQGGTVSSVDFKMTEAIAADLKIIGPDQLSNTVIETYTFSAKTNDQREASIDPQWSVDFAGGLDQLGDDGLVDPSDDFVGSLVLTLTDAFTGKIATKAISVTQSLVPGNTDLSVSNKKGVQLFIEDSCVTQNAVLQLRKPSLASSMKTTKTYQIVGDVYQLSPAGFTFNKPATMVLPVPDSKSAEGLTVGRWNTKWLEWEIVDEVTPAAGQLSIDISTLGRFAIMESAEPLGIHNIRFNPNPFSPNVAPLEILFDLTSDKTVAPKVTVKIYNMIGDLVKTLEDGKFMQKGIDRVLYWDGISDYGKMAMNGRYLIHFQVKDSSGDKEELKTFVLIK